MNFWTRNSRVKISSAVPIGAAGEKFLKMTDFFVNFHLNGIKNLIILAKKAKGGKKEAKSERRQRGGKIVKKEANAS